MPTMHVFTHGVGLWPDLADRNVIHIADDAPPIQLARLNGGMESGKSSVAIRIDLPDGSVVIAQTSMRLFQLAAAAFDGADKAGAP